MPEYSLKGSLVKCEKCGEEYFKFHQQLYFTRILSTPYIKCPKCGKKYYFSI